jgi:hypothetical protein
VSLAAAANMSADGIAGPITLQTTQKKREKKHYSITEPSSSSFPKG